MIQSFSQFIKETYSYDKIDIIEINGGKAIKLKNNNVEWQINFYQNGKGLIGTTGRKIEQAFLLEDTTNFNGSNNSFLFDFLTKNGFKEIEQRSVPGKEPLKYVKFDDIKIFKNGLLSKGDLVFKITPSTITKPSTQSTQKTSTEKIVQTNTKSKADPKDIEALQNLLASQKNKEGKPYLEKHIFEAFSKGVYDNATDQALINYLQDNKDKKEIMDIFDPKTNKVFKSIKDVITTLNKIGKPIELPEGKISPEKKEDTKNEPKKEESVVLTLNPPKRGEKESGKVSGIGKDTTFKELNGQDKLVNKLQEIKEVKDADFITILKGDKKIVSDVLTKYKDSRFMKRFSHTGNISLGGFNFDFFAKERQITEGILGAKPIEIKVDTSKIETGIFGLTEYFFVYISKEGTNENKIWNWDEFFLLK